MLSAAPRASLTLPSCSPNYPRAFRIGWTHARHCPFLKLKNRLIEKAFQSKEGWHFSFFNIFFPPEIFKFLLICKLASDDVTRCVCEGQGTKPSISLERMKQCNGNFAWPFSHIQYTTWCIICCCHGDSLGSSLFRL